MYVHANFQDATIYNKKVTREEALLFDPPSYIQKTDLVLNRVSVHATFKAAYLLHYLRLICLQMQLQYFMCVQNCPQYCSIYFNELNSNNFL